MTAKRRRAVTAFSIPALLVLGPVPSSRAAVGKITFKELKVGLSSAHHRPMAPVVVVHRIDGEWKPSELPVEVELSLSAQVNTFSSIFRLLVGVPSLAETSFNAWTAGFAEGSRKVKVASTTLSLRADEVKLAPMTSADLCAQAAPGQGDDFMVPFRLPLEVQVAASRGTTHVEQAFKTYRREIDAHVRCIVLDVAKAKPQRAAVKPQRTAPEPQRVPVKPQRTAVKPQRTAVPPAPAVMALPRPDLLIRTTRTAPDRAHRLEAEVVNGGAGDAGIAQLKLVYRRSGHVLEREAEVPALGAGRSTWVAIDLPGVIAPGIAVTLRVDDPDRIAETDEGNNGHQVN